MIKKITVYVFGVTILVYTCTRCIMFMYNFTFCALQCLWFCVTNSIKFSFNFLVDSVRFIEKALCSSVRKITYEAFGKGNYGKKGTNRKKSITVILDVHWIWFLVLKFEKCIAVCTFFEQPVYNQPTMVAKLGHLNNV